MRKKSKYTEEFKSHCVKHFEISGKSILKIAKSLEVPVSTLSGWIKSSKDNVEFLTNSEMLSNVNLETSKSEISVASVQKRIAELHAEVKILEQAIGILFKD